MHIITELLNIWSEELRKLKCETDKSIIIVGNSSTPFLVTDTSNRILLKIQKTSLAQPNLFGIYRMLKNKMTDIPVKYMMNI